MKFCLILGTRPEIIKMSPIIRALEKQQIDYFIIHTGQHYSYEMDKIFFKELILPIPKYNLDIGSGSHGRQTGKMLEGIEKVLMDEMPDIVLVEGDTNTVLAGALAASKLHIKVGHVEAGLRSFDRTMPEELNRIMTDHISDMLFAPTEASKEMLLSEGIPNDKIYVTGNTIVDAIYENLKISEDSGILERLGLSTGSYFLSTIHRQENVDNKERLGEIVKGLKIVSEKYDVPMILPIHPRTKKMLAEFGISLSDNVKVIDPLGFMDFLKVEANSRLVLSDSGGVQEECCILGVPCVTLRENTERPKTVQIGANVLAGYRSSNIICSVDAMLEKEIDWANPFGDGIAARRIIDICLKNT